MANILRQPEMRKFSEKGSTARCEAVNVRVWRWKCSQAHDRQNDDDDETGKEGGDEKQLRC